MANYANNNSNAASPTPQNMSSSYKTLIAAFCSGTPRRGKLFDFMFGADGTPADNAMDFDISRMTVDGTGVSSTPNALDPADAAALTTSKINYTVEPTVTGQSTVFYLGINQRASYRWVAAPGSELVWPATAANGLVMRAKSPGYTSTATAEAIWQEQ